MIAAQVTRGPLRTLLLLLLLLSAPCLMLLSWLGSVYPSRRSSGPVQELMWPLLSCFPRAQPHAGEESADDEERFVLKRIMVEKGAGVRLSGDRERYFGEKFNRRSASLLSGWPGEGGVDGEEEEGDEEGGGGGGDSSWPLQVGADHLVRFVEAFETRRGQELWLVFRDEGMSLHSLMYETATEAAQGDEEDGKDGRSEGAEGEDEEEETNQGSAELKILQPSRWWWRLRRREDSHRVLLGAVAAGDVTQRTSGDESLPPSRVALSCFRCRRRLRCCSSWFVICSLIADSPVLIRSSSLSPWFMTQT